MKYFGVIILMMLFAGGVLAAETIGIHVRPLDAAGAVQPNVIFPYIFVFANDTACTEAELTVGVSITTDNYGIGFVELDISGLNYPPQYLCENRSGSLRTVHNISTGLFNELYVLGNITAEGNITLDSTLTFENGEFIDNIENAWIRITANLNVTGDLNVTDNVSANFYYGNGSLLTGISTPDTWVNETGDTMTGNLTINAINPSLTLRYNVPPVETSTIELNSQGDLVLDATGGDIRIDASQLWLYDAVGDSPGLAIEDADLKTFGIVKYDAGYTQLWSDEGEFRFMPANDVDDYLQINTTSDQTTLDWVGQSGRITADDGEIDFDDENLTTTGNITAATFYGTDLNLTGNVYADEANFTGYITVNNTMYSTDAIMTGSSSIGTPVFAGTGNDDLTTGGTFNQPFDQTVTVEIVAGDPVNPNTFRWRVGTAAWSSTTAITGAAQNLDFIGVTATFGAVTGHDTGDQWTIVMTPSTATLDLDRITTGGNMLFAPGGAAGPTSSFFLSEDAGGAGHNTGRANLAIGGQALYEVETSSYNTGIGGYALFHHMTGGGNNVGVGYRALFENEKGAYNTCLGSQCIDSAAGSTGSFNSCIGAQCIQSLSTGTYNVGVGIGTLNALTSGSRNVAIGPWSASKVTTSLNNVIIGYFAGRELTAGDHGNTFIGHEAGNKNTGAYSVFIGHQTGYYETGSNKLYIDNSATGSPLVYGEFDNDFVRINGDVEVNGTLLVNENATFDQWVNITGDLNVSSEIFAMNLPGGTPVAGDMYVCWNATDGSLFLNETGC